MYKNYNEPADPADVTPEHMRLVQPAQGKTRGKVFRSQLGPDEHSQKV
jgi:hypothetical protein